MNVPAWAQKRADRLATGPHDRTVLVAYPQSRGVFAVPIIACIVAAATNIGVLVALLIAARGSGVAGTRTTVLLIAGIVVVTVLFAVVAYLVVTSFRTSVLATPRGVEIRQQWMRDTFVPWHQIARVEEQTHGYWAGTTVLALTSGKRIRIHAASSRRAMLYNGYRLADIHGRWPHAPTPWTQRLIDAHRAHLAGHV